MAESVVKLSVDDSSFNAHIKRAAKEFANFGSTIANVGVSSFVKFAKGAETAKVAFQNFNKALKANAIMFVASLAIEAAQSIGEMIANWVTGADEAEAAQKKLNEELERTAQLIKGINASTDFNSRLAKAMGKSTTDILKQELNGAKLAYNVADLKVKFLPKNASQEARDAANKLRDEAAKRLKAAEQNLYLDQVARQYQTGEYAPKGGGGKTKAKPEKLGGVYAPMAFAEGTMFDSSVEAMERIKNAAISIKSPLEALTEELKNLQEAQMKALSPEAWELYQQEIERVQGEMESFRGENKRGAKGTKESWKDAAAAMESVGSALASIEDPSAKIAGLIGQAVANIALGFAQATAKTGGITGVFGWIAAVAGGMATMLSTISAIHSATGYAQGGIVQGNSYSGDNIPAYLNAGETVLTAAQTNMLANNLRNGGLGNLNLTATVSGEQIRLALNNNGRRTGKGEYVQSSFVRI